MARVVIYGLSIRTDRKDRQKGYTFGGTAIDGSLFSLMAIDLAAMLILLALHRPGLTTPAPI